MSIPPPPPVGGPVQPAGYYGQPQYDPAKQVRKPRSIWWTIAVMAVGWSLLAYPAFYVIILSTLGFGLGIGHNGLTFGAIFTALLTVLAAGSMVALPALLGLAIRWRNKILWALSAVTGIVTAITLVRYQFPHL